MKMPGFTGLSDKLQRSPSKPIEATSASYESEGRAFESLRAHQIPK